MCEDWITEKYIDDVRNAAKNNYAAIKRVRELHHPFNPGSACDCCVVEDECDVCGEYYPCETIKALDGDK